MRAAGLLAALADAGRPVDRSGAGLLVEVYQAAALRIWGLASRSYKGTSNKAALGLLVAELRTALPDFDWFGHDAVCSQSDDALDAVVCARERTAASPVRPRQHRGLDSPAEQPRVASQAR